MALSIAIALSIAFADDAQAAKRTGKSASKAGAAKKAKTSKQSSLVAARSSVTALAASEQQPSQGAADSLFLEARRAYLNQESGPLEAAVTALADHPLAEYPRFWQLSLAIRGSTLSATTEAGVDRFLGTSKNPLLIDQLRSEWIVALVRRERWAQADQQGLKLQSRDDKSVQCNLWMAQIMQGAALAPAAREHLLAPRELGDGCNPLLAAAVSRDQLNRADLEQRLRLSAEAGAIATGRRTAALLGKDSVDFSFALKAPGYLLKKGSRDSDAVIMALALLARNDPEEAAAHLSSVKLSSEATQFVWAVIAAHGAQKLSPLSLEWTRRGVDARVSDETKAWMARSALAAGDWALVNKIVWSMSDQGLSDPTWVYWLARSFKELKQPERATPLFITIAGQWNFYGHLAADELGLSVAIPPVPAPITESEAAQAAGNPALARALKLYALGLRIDGNREWNFSLREMTDRQLIAAADYACKASILDRCVNTADRTRNEHNMALRFLTPFKERMVVFAKEQGLDPAWVYGLIRQESRFLIDARSHVGAQGLMQIMPKTGSWIARQLGLSGFTVRDLHDIDTNIRFGTYYLRDVSNRLEQSEVMASAAYNAGPGRPARWRQALNSSMEGAAFAEIIPFSETRDYVKKVLWNATWYSALASGKSQSLKARLGQISPRIEKLTMRGGVDSSPDEELERNDKTLKSIGANPAPAAVSDDSNTASTQSANESTAGTGSTIDPASSADAEPALEARIENFADTE